MTAETRDATVEEGSWRFRNVLFVPLAERGNAAAIRRVAALAGHDDAALTVVGVIPEPSHLQRLLHGSDQVDAVLAARHEEMRQRLSRCVRPIDGIDVASIIDVGDPALAVVVRAIAARHDLLVVTDDGDQAHRATIRRLVRKSPCPVWVLRPSRAKRVRVLAAIDPEPDQHALNRSILEIAQSVADAEAAELHVACAWELFGEATMQSSAFVHVDPEEIDSQRRNVRLAHERAVDELVGRHIVDRKRVAVHVHAGPPSRVIADVVSRHHINLLVMGTFGRTGVSGLVMGNTAEQVLDELRCSVVAVKPPDFVSPIRV